ncbi:effector binding domain-containing protein [Wukongibacter baidiensis]|uniref:effector binding domain-containing protein n=1 Tax=Wukongibacter baidiensis TaxID=1723361 RepID=UPI003D7F99B6
MLELIKIGDLATKYNISSRSLRYYEQIGILKSIRQEDSQYRYYDDEAINRLEQILILRKLQIPIKDICNIFSSQDLIVAVDAFTRKLKFLEEEIEELEVLKELVEAFLIFLREKGYRHTEGLSLIQERSELLSIQIKDAKKKKTISKEALIMERKSNKLSDHDVRIIELKPMTVAWYRAISTSPEKDAWDVMLKWIKEQELWNIATTRYFGFNNPNPTQGSSEYGYEVWVTIPSGTVGSEEIKVKEFSGGLYAVTSAFLYDIGERWEKLSSWVEKSDFQWAKHQWLEESIAPSRVWHKENTQLDLYHPIKEKNL